MVKRVPRTSGYTVPAGDDVLGVSLLQRLVTGGQCGRHEILHAAQTEQVFPDSFADMLEIVTGKILVEVYWRATSSTASRRSPVQDAVLHVAVGGDEDQQDAFLGKADELDLADFQRLAPGRQHDSGKTGQFGDEVRGAVDQLLRLRGMQLPFDVWIFSESSGSMVSRRSTKKR